MKSNVTGGHRVRSTERCRVTAQHEVSDAAITPTSISRLDHLVSVRSADIASTIRRGFGRG